MFIDTHCHLTDTYVADDIDAVIAHASDVGVGMIICPSANPNDVAAAVKIAETYPNIFATTGIHPEYAGVDASEYLTEQILTHPRVVGVGEIGLDKKRPFFEEQKRFFKEPLLLFPYIQNLFQSVCYFLLQVLFQQGNRPICLLCYFVWPFLSDVLHIVCPRLFVR